MTGPCSKSDLGKRVSSRFLCVPQAAGKLLPEVVAHDDFIGRTGVHGGWHPQVGLAWQHRFSLIKLASFFSYPSSHTTTSLGAPASMRLAPPGAASPAI